MASAIDWCQIRQNILLATQRIELYSPSYWNREECAPNENQPHWAELTKKQIQTLPLTKDLTVLDVGAGTGRITLPMAKRAKHVTALEPSERMLAALKEQAQKQAVFNLYYINKPFEELDLAARYDLVVASFSLFMFDIKAALRKMDALAEQAVYLFMSASPWQSTSLQQAIYGASSCWSDFIFIYNILYELGIAANVEISNYTVEESYSDLEAAQTKWMQTCRISSENKERLTRYLEGHLVWRDGKYWSTQERKAATVWWNKNQ